MNSFLNIYTDGGSRGNPGISGAGIFIEDEKKQEIHSISLSLGIKTNNEAEYMAFFQSLEWLKKQLNTNNDFKNKYTQINWFLDSKLVVEQLNKRWKIKESRLEELAKKCWEILNELKISYKISHIPRSLNSMADALANKAMDEGKEF